MRRLRASSYPEPSHQPRSRKRGKTVCERERERESEVDRMGKNERANGIGETERKEEGESV